MNIPVHAIWLAQDDPKKNTAVRASRDGLLSLHKDFKRLPRRGIILEPLCGKVLGPEDREIFNQRGALVGLGLFMGANRRIRRPCYAKNTIGSKDASFASSRKSC